MYESGNYSPTVMTTQAMSSYPEYHVPVKHEDEDARSHSPTEVYKAAPHLQMSPAATYHSTSSDPASDSYHDRSMGPPPPVPSSFVPNLSRWGGAVPQVITTEDPNASPHQNNNKALAKQKTVVTAKKRYTKTGKGSTEKLSKGDTVTARRQKRLERNRESARLSRRRRKHYLEVLEDRVTDLSVEVDQGRREHAAEAVETILEKRREVLQTENPTDSDLLRLGKSLNRTSQELLVVSTFQTQQLKSFALAPHIKFVLWLTLQGDTYFRGGRAASERLSAARIGERVSFRVKEQIILPCFHLLVLIIISCLPRCCKTETTRWVQRILCGPSFATRSVFLTTKKNAPATIKEQFFKNHIHGWIVIPPELLGSPCNLSMMLSTRLQFVSAKESMECRTVSRRHKR